MCFILDEVERADQRQNGYFAAGMIVDIPSERYEPAAHDTLIDKIICNLTNRSESLALCFLSIDFLGRVIQIPSPACIRFKADALPWFACMNPPSMPRWTWSREATTTQYFFERIKSLPVS